LQRYEPDFAEGPVRDEEVATVGAWEERVAVAGDSGGRTAAGGADRRNDVGEVGGRAPRLRELRPPPAVVAARHDVVEPARLVPGQPDAALVVRIEGERLAVEVEVE